MKKSFGCPTSSWGQVGWQVLLEVPPRLLQAPRGQIAGEHVQAPRTEIPQPLQDLTSSKKVLPFISSPFLVLQPVPIFSHPVTVHPQEHSRTLLSVSSIKIDTYTSEFFSLTLLPVRPS